MADVPVVELRGLGFSNSKARYLVGLGDVVSSGGLDLDGLDLMSREARTRTLQRLRGIGRWSAEYVLLSGPRTPRRFPGRRCRRPQQAPKIPDARAPPSYAEILAILAPWFPYAGIVYFHLLLDSLVDRGDLEV